MIPVIDTQSFIDYRKLLSHWNHLLMFCWCIGDAYVESSLLLEGSSHWYCRSNSVDLLYSSSHSNWFFLLRCFLASTLRWSLCESLHSIKSHGLIKTFLWFLRKSYTWGMKLGLLMLNRLPDEQVILLFFRRIITAFSSFVDLHQYFSVSFEVSLPRGIVVCRSSKVLRYLLIIGCSSNLRVFLCRLLTAYFQFTPIMDYWDPVSNFWRSDLWHLLIIFRIGVILLWL